MDLGFIHALPYLSEALNHPFSISISCDRNSLKTIGIFLIIYVLGIGIYLSNEKNYRQKEEYGSARWGIYTFFSKETFE